MEVILIIQLLLAAPLVISLPLILLLHFTRRWRYYRVLWLTLIIADAVAGIFFFLSLTAPRPQVSGPTAPFGDAPIVALWLLAFLATLPLLVYAFVWGRPKDHASS